MADNKVVSSDGVIRPDMVSISCTSILSKILQSGSQNLQIIPQLGRLSKIILSEQLSWPNLIRLLWNFDDYGMQCGNEGD